MIDHDRLFKELISTFFLEFMELFLPPAKMQLISGFVDTYLRLNAAEEKQFTTELARIEPAVQAEAMEIVTSWMERGIEQGLERGIEQGLERGIEQGLQRQRSLLLRQLRRRLSEVPPAFAEEVEALKFEGLETLGEALLDFERIADLSQWFLLNSPETGRHERRLRLLKDALNADEIPDVTSGLLEQLNAEAWQDLAQAIKDWGSVAELEQWLESKSL